MAVINRTASAPPAKAWRRESVLILWFPRGRTTRTARRGHQARAPTVAASRTHAPDVTIRATR
jgi:hypothetical protein